MGKVDLRGVAAGPLVTIPWPFHYGLGFKLSAFLPFVFMYLITVMESIGDLTATSSLTGQPISGPVYISRLQGGLLADGINSVLAACLNSFPSTTFAQNNGVIQLTGVGSRHVGTFVGVILVSNARGGDGVFFAVSNDSNILDGFAFSALGPGTNFREEPDRSLRDVVFQFNGVEIGSRGTRTRDETIKRRLYEGTGVLEYWFVDTDADVIRVYRRNAPK